jgi:hypothetical protein
MATTSNPNMRARTVITFLGRAIIDQRPGTNGGEVEAKVPEHEPRYSARRP